MRIVVCGSMSFVQEMKNIETKLQELGHNVIIPENIEKYIDGTMKIENKEEKIKYNLIKDHYDKINNADGIIVLNIDKKGIKNYIGANTFLEMGFAHVLDKRIYLLNEIPQMNYTDEIEAMQPVVLNGDLSKIK